MVSQIELFSLGLLNDKIVKEISTNNRIIGLLIFR